MKCLSKISILLIAVLLGFSSCSDEPDGKWAKMKWNNVDNLVKVNNIYVIPEEGGTFTFECKNYTPWLSRVYVNNEPKPIVREDLHEMWKKCIIDDWFEIEIVDKKMIIFFDRIDDYYLTERKVTVEVTAGDIFDTFIFQQQKRQ